MKTFLALLSAALLASYAVLAVAADVWPSNPIKLVVTFPPGGATDVTARLVADKLRADLGRPVIVDNKPGAGGNIGADFVAEAAPDGYTLLMATRSHVTNRTLYKSLPYDFVQDLALVSRVAFIPNMLVVNAPADIVAKLHSAIVKALAPADIKQRLAEQGSDPAGNTPAEFRQFIAGEVGKWAKLVQISGAKVD